MNKVADLKDLKLKNDLPASVVVFLVALPLCLGVALASGAPLISGLISGIIGGIVVGALSGSSTSVSGPAAGLTAVVLASITQLGGFETFLTAVIIAGVLQIVLGIVKGGILGNYVPSNVIKGLLAAIGIILILKQLPHAVGYDVDPENDFSFFQNDGENTFSELARMWSFITPGALVISVISLLLLILWDKTPLKKLKFLPPFLVVVLFGILMSYLFNKFVPALALEQAHLVTIPRVDGSNLQAYLHLPDLSSLYDPKVLRVAFTIALVASLETLLNIEAIDKLDPHKRKSPPNRELIAQGVGNILAGFFGGLPVTSVIVRSSVNMQSGNSTKLSTILHGVFMLVSIITISDILNLIPLASLASLLLYTGYKLAGVKVIKEMYKKGWNQFIPFAVTILAIVFTDLLIGVLIGLGVSALYLMRSNYKNPFTLDKEQLHIGEVVRLELANQVSFLNKGSIEDTLWQVPDGAKVIIDATYSDYIDGDVLESINDFKISAAERNIQLNIVGLKEKYELSDHIQFINVLDKETQQRLPPLEIVNLLKAGNERFVNGKWNEKYFRHQVNATSMGQNPMAVIVSCIDSRTSPEIVFDAGLGDLLSIRIAGNIVSPEIIGSIELSVDKIGAKLIVVMSHSNCGAIGLAIGKVKEGNIGHVTTPIETAIQSCDHDHSKEGETAYIECITKKNAENSVERILAQSSYLRQKLAAKEIDIVTAYYDTATGRVNFNV